MATNPDLFDKWRFITKFYNDPCDAPWTAYALALGGATAEAFVSLYSFDPGNAFWNAIESGTGIPRKRSQRKGLKGPKSKKTGRWDRIKKIWSSDPSSVLGHQLGKFSPLARRPLPGIFGLLWFIFGILDFANFVMFLAEVITQFLYRWMTLLWNSKYCQARDDAVVARSGPDYVMLTVVPPSPILTTQLLKIRGPITSQYSIVTVPDGWSGVVVAGFKLVAGRPGTSPIVETWITRNGVEMLHTRHRYEAPPDGEIDAGNEYTVARGGTYAVMIDAIRGNAKITNTSFYAHFQEPKKGVVAN